MRIDPRFAPAITGLIVSLFTAVLMSFISLAINYGFRPDFVYRWAFAATTGYLVLAPVMLFLVPRVQQRVRRMIEQGGK